jgi:acyl-coenzyme A synthetase/AMP-(fatty) acid ligase
MPINEIVERFNQAVLPFERIREVHYVEEIPRSPLRKVLKADLLKALKD